MKRCLAEGSEDRPWVAAAVLANNRRPLRGCRPSGRRADEKPCHTFSRVTNRPCSRAPPPEHPSLPSEGASKMIRRELANVVSSCELVPNSSAQLIYRSSNPCILRQKLRTNYRYPRVRLHVDQFASSLDRVSDWNSGKPICDGFG